MISEHTSDWKLHDWFFFIVLALRAFFAILTAPLHGLAPHSGLTQGIHRAGLQVSAFLRWIADFFEMLANWFAS
jgi:hypothetical protein